MVEEAPPVDPAEARKRRKAIITQRGHHEESVAVVAADAANGITTNSSAANAKSEILPSPPPSDQPTHDSEGDDVDDDNLDGGDGDQGPGTNGGNSALASAPGERRRKIEVRGGKRRGTQVRYDPEVPMTKEQLAMWRRECRRVRNRESAAASRARVRNRIQELEVEVEDWKAKYAHAMQRLEHLRQMQRDPAAPSANDSMKAAL